MQTIDLSEFLSTLLRADGGHWQVPHRGNHEFLGDVQSGTRDKNILRLARVPCDLRFSLVLLGLPGPFKALVSFKPDLMLVA